MGTPPAPCAARGRDGASHQAVAASILPHRGAASPAVVGSPAVPAPEPQYSTAAPLSVLTRLSAKTFVCYDCKRPKRRDKDVRLWSSCTSTPASEMYRMVVWIWEWPRISLRKYSPPRSRR